MKQVIISILAMVSFHTAMAQITDVPAIKHEMSCVSKGSNELPIIGVNYSMNCYVGFMQPAKYNVISSCELLRTIVYPNAQPVVFPLTAVKQTVATLMLENKTQNIKVKVNKMNLSARVQLANGAILKCTDNMRPGLGGMSGSN